MIKALISDFSRVILSPKDDSYNEGLNALHKKLSAKRDYDFWSYFKLNKDLLSFYKTLSKQIDLYVFTTEYIQEHPELQSDLEGVFKKVFSGAHLGLKKTAAKSYKIIANDIGLEPEEILYVDDKQENIEAAKAAGMMTICYKSNAQAIKNITELVKT